MQNKTFGDVVAIVIAGVVGVVAYIVSMQTSMFGAVSDPLTKQVASLGLSILFVIIGERVAFTFRNKSITEQIKNANDRLLSIVRSEIDSEVFEDTTSAHHHINLKIKTADKIYNTVIRISENAVHIDDFYDADTTLAWNKNIAHMLEHGGTFHNVFSSNIKSDTDSTITFMEKVKGLRDYRAWQITDCKVPLTNFIIIYKKNEPTEVLYGWAFDVLDIKPHVFLSRNPKLIQYFEAQFRALKNAGEVYFPKNN